MTGQRARGGRPTGAHSARRKRFFRLLAVVLTVLVAGALAAPPAGAQNLTTANVQQIIAAAVLEADARGLNATVAVVQPVWPPGKPRTVPCPPTPFRCRSPKTCD